MANIPSSISSFRKSKWFWPLTIILILALLGSVSPKQDSKSETTTSTTVSQASTFQPINEEFSISTQSQRAIQTAINDPSRNNAGYLSVTDFLWQNMCFYDYESNPIRPKGTSGTYAHFVLRAEGKAAKKIWKEVRVPWSTCKGDSLSSIVAAEVTDQSISAKLKTCCVATTTTTTLPKYQRFFNNADTVSISSLADNGWSYEGSKIKVQCIVSSPIKDDYGMWNGFNCFSGDYSNVIYADLSETWIDTTKLTQDTWVTIWGEGGPQFKGTNAYGGTVQHTSVLVRYVQTATYSSWR
jgi:hypothetical protein